MKKLFYVSLLASSILLNMIFFSRFVYNRYFYNSPIEAKSKPYTKMVEEVYEHCPNDSNEIILLGNSITAAFRADEFYPDLNIKNRGISGNTTNDILRRLKEVTASNPEKIFLLVGVNDVIQGVDEKIITKNYQKIVTQIIASSPETKIYLQSIMPLSKEVSDYFFSDNTSANEKIIEINNKIKNLAIEFKLYFIDLNEVFQQNNELNPAYSWDGIHINAAGYQLWNKTIKRFLVNNTDEN